MGNAMIAPPCVRPPECTPKSSAKLVSYGGATRFITRKTLAGDIMFQYPDTMVCRADAFFIGQRIPSLGKHDHLVKGRTYFLLPIDFFPSEVLSVSSLAALISGGRVRKMGDPIPVSLKESPFEYSKGTADGRVSIKIAPEFIARLIRRPEGKINGGGDDEAAANSEVSSLLCSTPELKKHYDQLVGFSKGRVWCPKLETISE